MHIDGARLDADWFDAPHTRQDLLARDCALAMRQQEGKDGTLRFGQVRTSADGPGDLAAFEIDLAMPEPGMAEPGRSTPRGAAQYCLDAGEQLARGERLDDIIIRAHLQAAHPVIFAPARGQYDNRY